MSPKCNFASAAPRAIAQRERIASPNKQTLLQRYSFPHSFLFSRNGHCRGLGIVEGLAVELFTHTSRTKFVQSYTSISMQQYRQYLFRHTLLRRLLSITTSIPIKHSRSAPTSFLTLFPSNCLNIISLLRHPSCLISILFMHSSTQPQAFVYQ